MQSTFTAGWMRRWTGQLARTAMMAAALLIGASAYAQNAPRGTLLTGVDLHAMLDHWALFDFRVDLLGVKGTVTLSGNGGLQMVWMTAGGQTGTDTGHWRIEGDTFCSRWTIRHAGEETCSHRYRVDENRYEARSLTDGRLLNVYSVRGWRHATTNATDYRALAAHYKLQMPNGPGPFPAVILVPWCTGFESGPAVKAHYDAVQSRLVEQGFLTVRVDAFTAWGKKNCITVSADEGAGGIAWVVADLRLNPHVKRDAINLLGWSWGGASVLRALEPDGTRKPVRVARVVAYYPGCKRLSEGWSSEVPVLVLHGDIDTLDPLSDCRRLFERLPKSAHVNVQVLKNARHGFDVIGLPAELHTAFGTLGSNPQAAKEAWGKLIAFLQR